MTNYQYTSSAYWNTSPPNMKSYFALSCLLAFVAVASANPIGGLGLPLYSVGAQVDSIPNSNYGFNYAVNDPSTGDNKAQWESRNGDVVQGAYSLVEPDGNIRLVEYTADPLRGFNAVVKRTGPNIHSVSAIPVAAPVAPIAEVAHVAEVAEAVPLAPTYDLGHYAPLAPVIEHAPIIDHAPIPQWDISPLWLPQPSPWVHLSGSSWGHKGNIVRRWAAGPISLDGKTLTIRTKHH